MTKYRLESDLLGAVEVPAAALWGVRTQREGRTVKDVIVGGGLIDEQQFNQLTSPEAVTHLGNWR